MNVSCGMSLTGRIFIPPITFKMGGHREGMNFSRIERSSD